MDGPPCLATFLTIDLLAYFEVNSWPSPLRTSHRLKSEERTRVVQRVVEIPEKVLFSNLLEYRRARECNEWLHMDIRQEHGRSIFTRAVHDVLERVHRS